MRLIDADALKEEVNKKKVVGRFNTLLLIDNAPTVEANSIIDGLNNQIDDLSDELAWYVNERNRLLEGHRLQGEWVRKEDDICYWYECSKCGCKASKDSSLNFVFSKFCPNCGAKMRGDVNDK